MAGQDEIGDRLLVIFDGHCGLCNRSVRWLLVRDSRDRLRFVASESPKIAGLLERHGLSANLAERNSTVRPEPVPGIPSTILVVQDAGGPTERVLIRSDAVISILRALPRPWPAIGKALGWIPRPLRDLGYRLIARWRYRIWGRLESCPVPTAEERTRFL
jgi:predicted DCC family thiol-disulfide oxidoreductase YuxK